MVQTFATYRVRHEILNFAIVKELFSGIKSLSLIHWSIQFIIKVYVVLSTTPNFEVLLFRVAP